MFLNDTPGVLEAFRRLRNLGVGLSVDDFGTGYSNLRSLEAFPVTEIKIDRSFVGGLTASPSKTVIVRAIIDLGRALKLAVIAEGVETEAQRALLEGTGCQIGQGFLLGRPVDGEAFAAKFGGVSADRSADRAVRHDSFRTKTSFGSLATIRASSSDKS